MRRAFALALIALLLAAAGQPAGLAPAAAPHAPTVAAHRKPVRHRGHRPAAAVAPAPPPPAAPPAPPAPAKPAPPKVPANIGSSTGLPLPRYAALKTDDVNMRSGPGERYPVLWTYKRRDLPVQITREFDVWRLVTDMEGVRGWMHAATLTGHRSFVIITATDATLRATPNDAGDPVAILRPGVVGRLRHCDAVSAWCEAEAGGYRGYLARRQFWGVDAGEVIGP